MTARRDTSADSAARSMWLVAELCSHASLYSGWHLYLRDTDRFERNADGGWGWLRRGHLQDSAHAVLLDLGIAMRPGGDGSCDDDGYAALARRFPIRRSKRRGGIPVLVVDGSIHRLGDPPCDDPPLSDRGVG